MDGPAAVKGHGCPSTGSPGFPATLFSRHLGGRESRAGGSGRRGGGGGGALKMGGMMLACPEVCLPTVNRGEFSLGAALTPSLPCTPQPNLCYRDLHSALLLDPKHPQAKVLLQVMVGQAEQARQDAGVLAVQGKLQHALQCINCAIENNPLDPSFPVCIRRDNKMALSWVPFSPQVHSFLYILTKQ